MKPLKDLAASDFPGVDSKRFDEWKQAQLAVNKAMTWPPFVVFGTMVVTVPLIGGAIGWLLPIISYFAFMFSYARPQGKKAKDLSKDLGFDVAAIRRARRG